MAPHRLQPREVGIAALAVLLYALLLDAVVETFLRGSALRWVVGGAAAGYLVLSVLLRRRIGWGARAALSLLVFLGILAFTAWQPEGLDRGVAMLRQPTAAVLAAVTGLGVLLAGLILVRAQVLPAAAKAGLALLALYGAAALAAGAGSGAPYSDLFRGGSLWHRLPFWLQGPFVGALVLIPIAIVVELARGLARAGRKALGSSGLQAAVLALCVVVAAAGMRAPTGGASARPVPRPFLPESTLDRSAAIAAAKRLLDRSGMRTADINAAAAAIGPDLDAMLGYMRTFALDPYQGSLLGDHGTLMAQRGNSLDRSLLLASLLRRQGHRARLVHGRLTDGDARRLLELARQDPAKRPGEEPAMTVEEIALAGGLPVEEVRSLRQAVEAKRLELGQILRERVRRDVAFLRRQLETAGVRLLPAPGPTLEDVRDHFWVQVEVDREWRDLDPLASEGQVGQRLAEPGGEIPTSPLPDRWVHALRVRLLATYEGGGGSRANEVLDVTLRVPDLAGRWLVLGFPPQDGVDPPAPETANSFQPILVAGTRQHKGRIVYLDASKARRGGPSGLLGAATGERAPELLQRLDVEFTLRAPGADDMRVTRAVVRATGRIEQARQEIVSLYHFVATGGPLSLEWLTSLYLLAAESAEAGSRDVVPFDLLHLADAMMRPEPGEVAGQAAAPRRHHARPLLLGQRVRLQKDRQGEEKVVKSMDILHSRSEFASGDPVAALEQGVLETHLERLLFEGLEVANTTVVFERTRAPVAVLRPGEIEDLDRIKMSAVAKAWVQEDLAAGYAVVIPAEGARISGAMTTGWWRVRPEGGETLGRMEGGEGQSMTERIILTLPSAYAFGMGWYCKEKGLRYGICDPCTLMVVGTIGALLGFAAIIKVLEGVKSMAFWAAGRIIFGGGGIGMSMAECLNESDRRGWYR